MAASPPPVPRHQPELIQRLRLQTVWMGPPRTEIPWMWMALVLISRRICELSTHSVDPGWLLPPGSVALHGQTRHLRVPGWPATQEQYYFVHNIGLFSFHEADFVHFWSLWPVTKGRDSLLLETSPSSYGPWLKIPAQAELGGDWLKDLTSLVFQLGRQLTLQEVCLFSVLRWCFCDNRIAATLLNRTCLRLVGPTWQVRRWKRTTQCACVTGACHNLALHPFTPVGTLQFPSITGCVSGLVFPFRPASQELGQARRPAQQGLTPLSLNHLVFQCMWVNPYAEGISPWRGKTAQQGKSVMCGNGVIYFGSITCAVQMTTLGKARNLSRPPTTPEYLGPSPSHGRSGKGGAGETLTSVTTNATTALGEDLSRAVNVSGPEAFVSHLGNAVAVDTGLARNTWWPQLVWRAMFPCVHVTISWKRNLVLNSLGSVTNGNKHPRDDVAWQSRLEHLLDGCGFREAWLRRPKFTCGECMSSKKCLLAFQRGTDRCLRYQKAQRFDCYDVSCVRNLNGRTFTATWFSLCLSFLACPVRTWTAGPSRTCTRDHCFGVVWNLFTYAGMFQQPYLHGCDKGLVPRLMLKPSNNETRCYYRRTLSPQDLLLHLSSTRRWQRPWWRDLIDRHARERRWIYFQYGLRCPDDYPWQGLGLVPARDY
eukprot:6491260-Amphidinium_carterae.1